MPERDRIIAEAREWIGTPFHWEASVKGRGCDCKGLVAGVARNLGYPEAESAFASMGCYARGIDTKLLRRGLEALFDPCQPPPSRTRTQADWIATANLRPGDILLLRVGGAAQHLAILSSVEKTGKMIHTYGKGPKRVLETPMGAIWWAALDSAWMWRGVESGG